jgi:hypothetical protein
MENKDKIIETMQLLLYKESRALLEKIDLENEKVFLDPLLFAYFNSKNDNMFSQVLLFEIMQGYFNEKVSLSIEQSINSDGLAYLPNIGYFDKQKNKIDEILFIEGLEVLKKIHPLLQPYFYESYKGHITNKTPLYNSNYSKHLATLQKALKIIKLNLPDFYSEFIIANHKIFIHDNPKILNFASIQTLGMLYFYTTQDSTLLYFIEELIHQGSHNILYYKTYPKSDYFKIDASNIIMRDLTKQAWDYRDVYGAFHGVYTVYKRVECYDILLKNNVMKGPDKHELLGRLTDQFSRFRTGLELLNLDEVYTEKGKQLYLEIDSRCSVLLEKYKSLKSIFDLSNRDLDFNYNDFCILNPLEKFNSLDKNGIFNFK